MVSCSRLCQFFIFFKSRLTEIQKGKKMAGNGILNVSVLLLSTDTAVTFESKEYTFDATV